MAEVAGDAAGIFVAASFRTLIASRYVSTPRLIVLLVALAGTTALTTGANALPCTGDPQCAADEKCHKPFLCGQGVCVPAFTLPEFVIGIPGLTAYGADVVSTLDHTGAFYQNCCDTNITAFTGESADRANGHVFCPEEPTNFPACLFATCLCAYLGDSGQDFVVNGAYASPFGAQYLYYAGHAGYDYDYGFGVDLVAGADGMLCKALEDPINGRFGFATAWDKFHTFYIDHGSFAGRGHASWYLHAADLAGQDTGGNDLQDLNPGECAPVTQGQLVAKVGNAGTGLPHLHFEVRRYDTAEGPEGFGSRVVDPYGWTGAYPDPWSDPGENPQAESQIAPLWIACGNGRVECNEDCDDGNAVPGDGCDATCAQEPGFVCEGDQPTRCFQDFPISARKLVLKRTGAGKETLVLVSPDDAFPFPPIGSANDPVTGSPGGLEVDILSATGEQVTFRVPGGETDWQAKEAAVSSYRYRNRDAPSGPTAVRLVRLKEGRTTKIVARSVGLALSSAQGAVAIRIVTGNVRSCALFHPSTALVLRDEPNRFQAKSATAAGLADCSAASLGLP